MDQQKHWDKIGKQYDDEIFDVFKSDRNGTLHKYFRKHASKKATAIDFGCGNGKAFEYLSPSFKEVLALDISDELISIAKARGYTNIKYKRADLTRSNLQLPPANFGLCCNVALLPTVEANLAILKTISKGLKQKGTALVVLPSMESLLFASWTLVNWYKREGVSPDNIPQDELDYYTVKTTDLVQGVMKINGVATKHYTHSEIQVLFNEAGLNITAIEKLEYDWNSEFDSPPSWLNAPYPWDWMVECEKGKR